MNKESLVLLREELVRVQKFIDTMALPAWEHVHNTPLVMLSTHALPFTNLDLVESIITSFILPCLSSCLFPMQERFTHSLWPLLNTVHQWQCVIEKQNKLGNGLENLFPLSLDTHMSDGDQSHNECNQSCLHVPIHNNITAHVCIGKHMPKDTKDDAPPHWTCRLADSMDIHCSLLSPSCPPLVPASHFSRIQSTIALPVEIKTNPVPNIVPMRIFHSSLDPMTMDRLAFWRAKIHQDRQIDTIPPLEPCTSPTSIVTSLSPARELEPTPKICAAKAWQDLCVTQPCEDSFPNTDVSQSNANVSSFVSQSNAKVSAFVSQSNAKVSAFVSQSNANASAFTITDVPQSNADMISVGSNEINTNEINTTNSIVSTNSISNGIPILYSTRKRLHCAWLLSHSKENNLLAWTKKRKLKN